MVLERGEKLELLVDKTEQLQNSAFTFQKQSKKLKNAMFWKKVRAGLWTESRGKPLPRDDFAHTIPAPLAYARSNVMHSSPFAWRW